MKNIDIRLSNGELMVAALVGSMRRLRGMSQGRNKYLHSRKSDWATDADGAAAELALAKHLNVYWSPGLDAWKAPDVGPYQVRSTTHVNGKLILRENDNEHDTYVFVVCTPPSYRLVGAIAGIDAKRPVFHQPADAEGAAAWWIPQAHLGDLPDGCLMRDSSNGQIRDTVTVAERG